MPARPCGSSSVSTDSILRVTAELTVLGPAQSCPALLSPLPQHGQHCTGPDTLSSALYSWRASCNHKSEQHQSLAVAGEHDDHSCLLSPLSQRSLKSNQLWSFADSALAANPLAPPLGSDVGVSLSESADQHLPAAAADEAATGPHGLDPPCGPSPCRSGLAEHAAYHTLHPQRAGVDWLFSCTCCMPVEC